MGLSQFDPATLFKHVHVNLSFPEILHRVEFQKISEKVNFLIIFASLVLLQKGFLVVFDPLERFFQVILKKKEDIFIKFNKDLLKSKCINTQKIKSNYRWLLNVSNEQKTCFKHLDISFQQCFFLSA